ncbi:AzlC family ABC transporter permease [Streptomyces enissocaesilis]|uniref:AzlC family ABC transporter permease n=1 Tax=Streptomyces enissocaesilis TaxID=332589 RepID=A0ABN3XJ27_9ACTN
MKDVDHTSDPSPLSPPASVRAELPAIASVVTATFLFGVTFGAVAGAAGISTPAALVMSLTTFGGAAQMGAASVIAAGGGVGSAILTGSLLNLRYLPMAIAAMGAYGGSRWRRGAYAQLLGDETWALSRRPDGSYDRRLLLLSGSAAYVLWFAGTALGALSVGFAGDVSRWGLDMVSPAIFLALLWKQLGEPRTRVVAAVAAVLALALVPVAPPGVPVAVASCACLIGFVK